MTQLKDEEKIMKGQSRLYKIVMLESPHLIWRVRCQRRITNEDKPELFQTDVEIHNQWVSMMNKCLRTNCLRINKIKWGKNALSKHLVLQTWGKVVDNHETLLDDWTQQAGVLVGIRPLHPPGRNR